LVRQYEIRKKEKVKNKLIAYYKVLSKKALREPRTGKEFLVREKWERVRSILIKRYEYYG